MLRGYQKQAVAALWEALSGDVNRVAMEMATGLGKTITFAAAADEWLKDNEGARVLVLVHTDELVRQAVEKIIVVTRGRWSVGVVKAGRNEVDSDIVVASKDTLAQPGRAEQITDVGFIIVDECHHALAQSYQDVLAWFGGLPDCQHLGRDPEGCWDCRNTGWTQPPVPVLGVTATLARSDGQGLGQVWQDVVFTRSLPWAIRKGHLIDLVPYTIKVPTLDLSSERALDAMLADSIAPEAVVDAWMEKCPDGPSTVLFAPLVKSAQAFADAFSQAGVKAEVVHGKLGDAERQAVLARYEAGVTTVICNAMVLTEGWDSPRTMCVIVARPTKSVPLFVQMVGRGLRPWLTADAPPREDQRCILLTLSDGTRELATVADLSDKPLDAVDGKTLLAMEDEWDIGRDIKEDEDRAYSGPVVVERWDEAVQASSKAWKYTKGGAPFLPTAKRGEGYVFVVETARGWEVWTRVATRGPGLQPALVSRLATAPDLELAMALAEDEAQERGGDIGRLLADKGRAWRKAVPSAEMIGMAQRLGINVIPVMESKAGGKAGRLSDQIDRVTASKVLDPIVTKIKERASA